VGPRTSLDGFGEEKKSLAPVGTRTSDPPARRYTDCAVWTQYVFSFGTKMCSVLDGVSNFKHNFLFLKMFCPP
jgi:hypothetical protein